MRRQRRQQERNHSPKGIEIHGHGHPVRGLVARSYAFDVSLAGLRGYLLLSKTLSRLIGGKALLGGSPCHANFTVAGCARSALDLNLPKLIRGVVLQVERALQDSS